MATADRACLRCIAKKRKCDHERPSCGLCVKAGHECEYPGKRQKRGPTPGSSKASELRVQQLENALFFVLGVEGVEDCLRGRLAPNQLDEPVPPAPSVSIEKQRLVDLWKARPLRSYLDLLHFRQELYEMSEEVPKDDTGTFFQRRSTSQVYAVNERMTQDIQDYSAPSQPPNPVSNLEFLASSALSQPPLPSLTRGQSPIDEGSGISPVRQNGPPNQDSIMVDGMTPGSNVPPPDTESTSDLPPTIDQLSQHEIEASDLFW
ncbi:hypothetical protein I302_100021 [Kwoniella bestiolae CBS 10118]|uniref:Zn(2)-C6 fungal-type domain-containing protein n=1 Tax=Kwoniella bestiolae CBS 10118 TaxID=1296100 RepID=A0A1B9G3Z6_9TREE|nr:hypothetical protein I302_03393 [Kwoniella bestiolae CBS 10118]OCF25720.1 hypothetical protein I302_03393 [Kwoniella bestiolae CBS 10118]